MYRSTIRACYVGNLVGALVTNLSPLLFVTLMHSYSLTFEMVGRLTLINFFTQIIADLAFSRPVDKHGVRPYITLGHLLVCVGFILFALSPIMFPANPYVGIVLATIVFSCGGGLLELLLSAIVQAIPSEAKASAMSLLHSFYAWGFIAVVLITTFMLHIFGAARWPIIIIIWSIIPLINGIVFFIVPLAPQVAEHHRTSTSHLLRSSYFIFVVIGIALGGAAEVSMSQWISAYAESSLGLSKSFGDLIGVTLFATFLGLGRLWYGTRGKHFDIWKVMLWGSLFASACYITAALSSSVIIALIACAACGLGVSLLWPGSVSNAAHHFPLAGASLFAILAAGGDTGAALGPWLVGLVADVVPKNSQLVTGGSLRAGLLVGTLFPLAMVCCLLILKMIERRMLTTSCCSAQGYQE